MLTNGTNAGMEIHVAFQHSVFLVTLILVFELLAKVCTVWWSHPRLCRSRALGVLPPEPFDNCYLLIAPS